MKVVKDFITRGVTDIVDGSVSSMSGSSHDNLASLPMFHCMIAPINSTLLIVPRIQPSGSFKYCFCISFFS
jgi:hypothetical protein